MQPSGTGCSRSRRTASGLGAVWAGVEEEGAVVARAVRRAGAGPAVVGVPGVDPRLRERIDCLARRRAEADVQPAGHGMVGIRSENVPVLPLDDLVVR